MTTEFDDRYTQYQSRRSWLRKVIRILYLRKAAAELRGPTLDFGCGVGELLERLPEGSKGVEYNQASVEYCRRRALAVEWYDGYADGWSLRALPVEWRFQSMVISHVLEHLDEPMGVLRALLKSAEGRGVTRTLVIVPGKAGFRIDATHRTFVGLAMLQAAGLEAIGWHIVTSRYFPGDWERIGDRFPHHELQVVLEKI